MKSNQSNSEKKSTVEKSKAFVYVFDVTDGNPNGDPKLDNMPRTKADGRIWVSSESQKRKIRDKWIREGLDVFISEGPSLNSRIQDLPGKIEEEKNIALLEKYIDARVFGVVANTGDKNDIKAGVVHGPVQIHDACSVNTPLVESSQIIRVVQAKEDNNHTMGNRYKVHYAALKGSGQLCVHRASKAGMSEEDYTKFIESLRDMFIGHASNSSGIQRMRKLFVFTSDSYSMDIGIALDAVKVTVRNEDKLAESYDDIEVTLDRSKLPEHVTVEELL